MSPTVELRPQIRRLMSRAADGDRDAVDPLFSLLWPRAYAFARRVVNNPDDAQDVTQRALCTLFHRLPDYDDTRDGLAWAFTLVWWEARSENKRRARRRESGAQIDLHAEMSDPEHALVERDLRDALRSAVEDLSETEQLALLAELNDPARQEVSPATWRKRRQRALSRLRQIWRLKHGTE